MNNETKKGRGGFRKNSGMKSTGIETVTVRIDKRLLNAVTEIKDEFKAGKSLDDILSKSSQNLEAENKKLLRKITSLEKRSQKDADSFLALLISERAENKAEIERLNETIHTLNRTVQLRDAQISMLRSSGKSGGIDDKLRKRLIQFCHPDPIQDPRKKIDCRRIDQGIKQPLNSVTGIKRKPLIV